MREIFTYGSVGRALRKQCLYPEEGPGKPCHFQKAYFYRILCHLPMLSLVVSQPLNSALDASS